MIVYASVGGIEVGYTSSGAGPPLILLHGGEGDHRMFDGVAVALGRSFKTIAYDQRDCGTTIWTKDEDYPFTDLADEAAGLISALGHERAHVLGHSVGGMIAQVLAARWPEKVDCLILEATLSLLEFKDQFTLEVITQRRSLDDVALAKLFSSPEYVAEHPEFTDVLKRLRGSPTADQIQRRGKALMDDVELDLSRIKAPTLVFSGERDQILPRSRAQSLADSIPGARLEFFSDAGHLGIFQNPDKFVEVVTAFLSG